MTGAAAALVEDVPVSPLPPQRFERVLSETEFRRMARSIDRAGALLAGRTVWNVNSTARGGGVAEMLRSLIGYAQGAGVDARWVTISGDAPFFAVTKRLHNRLHGFAGDGGSLGPPERAAYEAPLRECAGALRELVRGEDLVILHDPQTAGLVWPLARTGARIAWRSHVGYDRPDQMAREAWRFLLPYVREADACVFSRPSYAWGGIDERRLAFIHPSIDVFSVKNQELNREEVSAILAVAGVIDAAAPKEASFRTADGTAALVRRSAELVEDSRLEPSTPVVTQVSRWDHLKDPLGVMEGFARHLAPDNGAHLLLAGPAPGSVPDDPEAPAALEEVRESRARLERGMRERIHLASLPMDDAEENAAIVNAIQRHATIVCQKSIAEGFGLTVAEAMWKSRPVVASRVGGIQDQVVHGVSGLLIDDPRDLPAFGAALGSLLQDRDAAAEMGAAARARTRDEFLGAEHLMQYLALFERLLR